MAVVFNPAPGWPTPPDGWLPPVGWQPPRRWPAPPSGWVLYLELPEESTTYGSSGSAQLSVAQRQGRADRAFGAYASTTRSRLADLATFLGARAAHGLAAGRTTPPREARIALVTLLLAVVGISGYFTWTSHTSSDALAEAGCVTAVAAAADARTDQVSVRGVADRDDKGLLGYRGTIAPDQASGRLRDWTCTTVPGGSGATMPRVALTPHDSRAPVWPSRSVRGA